MAEYTQTDGSIDDDAPCPAEWEPRITNLSTRFPLVSPRALRESKIDPIA